VNGFFRVFHASIHQVGRRGEEGRDNVVLMHYYFFIITESASYLNQLRTFSDGGLSQFLNTILARLPVKQHSCPEDANRE
jgi:hypothetical protein